VSIFRDLPTSLTPSGSHWNGANSAPLSGPSAALGPYSLLRNGAPWALAMPPPTSSKLLDRFFGSDPWGRWMSNRTRLLCRVGRSCRDHGTGAPFGRRYVRRSGLHALLDTGAAVASPTMVDSGKSGGLSLGALAPSFWSLRYGPRVSQFRIARHYPGAVGRP
jgi:hypothetical protein